MISIIIPTFNEAAHIGHTIRRLQTDPFDETAVEIIVADGGSQDATLQEATNAGARAVVSPRKGRGAQMNYGAAQAKGAVLYFLHADSIPPAGFIHDIQAALAAGCSSGCYR